MSVQVEVQGPVGAAVPILASFQARVRLKLPAKASQRYATRCCNAYKIISQGYESSLVFEHIKPV